MNKELLDKRLRGELPTITIAGDPYIIDWRLKELRSQENAAKSINLSQLDMNGEGTEYLCLFDTKNKTVIYNPADQSRHEQVAILHIPYELKLDPVGVARQYGLKDTELLDSFPIQEKLEARLEPLGKRLEQKQKTQQKNNNRQKTNHGKRKGKRL